MATQVIKSLFGAGLATVAAIATADAGGFARGTADTDILFEPGNFAMRSGVTVVSPTREFTAHGRAALVGTDYTETYAIPSAAIKMQLHENLGCAGTYTQAYGGSVRYAAPTLSGKLEEDFGINEFALTCAANMQVGKGRFYVLGGVFMEDFSYDRLNQLLVPAGPGAGTPIPGAFANLQLSGEDHGFRVGAAYAIPEIALRAQVMYRSETSYGASGSLTVPGFAVGSPATAVTVPALGFGNLPQSVELKVQSGVAPGWLVFGSVKWMDWSVQQNLLVTNPVRNSLDTYNWRDGWTFTGGVGHAFNEQISGLVAFTYDRGVGTGWDLSSDTYTLSVGGSFKDAIGGELRAGAGATYISSARETQYSLAAPPGSPAFGVNSAVDAGWAWAFNFGYAVKW